MSPELEHARERDRRRRADGWGFVGEEPTAEEVDGLTALLGARFPEADLTPRRAAPPAPLPPPRVTPPGALAPFCTTADASRRLHALGRSFADIVAATGGALRRPPDVVACPRGDDEVEAVLGWAADVGAAVVPFGGGTSVVGGVTPPEDRGPVVTLQTRSMDRVVEVDRTARAALVEAGATGPVAEAQLRSHGLTLRFYPQSFELSTVGGWIATRAAGHFATGPTHIDDLVEAVTAVAPAGRWESRRLPASGAGPSPDRLLLGSEGALGVVTRAWLRLQDRPDRRASATVLLPTLAAGFTAVRRIVQAGLQPANCRLLDPMEALLNGVADGTAAVLVLGFESAHVPVAGSAEQALGLALDAGGRCPQGVQHGAQGAGADATAGGRADASMDAAGAWRRSFLRAPYLRDALVARGMIVETFETACTWAALEALHEDVSAAVGDAVRRVCGDGIVTCRLTHAYPDGAAPYFTVVAPGRRGREVGQWGEIKAAASEALLAAGGTITHHHAVGRDHRPWYDRQRPDVFAMALTAAKRAVDPGGLLNPGVLVG